MSGRSNGRGWDRPRTPSWVYALVGVLLTLVVVLAIVIFMLVGDGSSGLASATSTPTIPPAGATPTTAASEAGAASSAPTPGPTQGLDGTPAATPAPTPAPTSGANGSPLPSGSIKPTLVSITIPHKADCNGDNGTGTAGSISITWSTLGATGVRISIDPPTAAGAYGYGYADYATPTTSAVVPFACDATLHDSGGYYHLYVVTTLHTTGYYQYRYQKVYQSPAPTP